MNPIAQPSALTSFSPSIKGAVEILNQGLEFLLAISDSDYLTRAKPHVTSSIGEHTRHTLDLFHALILKENATVDYNTRRRDHPVEFDRSIALKEIHYVINWLERLDRRSRGAYHDPNRSFNGYTSIRKPAFYARKRSHLCCAACQSSLRDDQSDHHLY